MALNCKTPPWQERQSRALQFEHQQPEFSSDLMWALLPPTEQGSRMRRGGVLGAVFCSQLPLTALTIIQCQSIAPHFHIPISFVSRGQTGTGALLWQILEGGHGHTLLTTAITANARPAAAAERQREARQRAVQRWDTK